MLTEENLDTIEGMYTARKEVDGCVHRGSVFAGWRRIGWHSAPVALLLGIVGLGAAACGPRRVNVMYTPQQTLVAIGYSADRSQSIFRANDDAQLYCERRQQAVSFLKEDTIYQGHYDEDVTVAARTAGRVAGALGSPKGAQAGRALSSPTDYKTTFEFLCK